MRASWSRDKSRRFIDGMRMSHVETLLAGRRSSGARQYGPWFLAIPHYVVLAVLSVGALFTGRYPRALFDYVVSH
jgi:hypothetical protein